SNRGPVPARTPHPLHCPVRFVPNREGQGSGAGGRGVFGSFRAGVGTVDPPRPRALAPGPRPPLGSGFVSRRTDLLDDLTGPWPQAWEPRRSVGPFRAGPRPSPSRGGWGRRPGCWVGRRITGAVHVSRSPSLRTRCPSREEPLPP